MPQILTPVARPRRVGKYLDLPEEMRAEYLDARALLNPAPALAHQLIYRRLSRHRSRRSPARPRLEAVPQSAVPTPLNIGQAPARATASGADTVLTRQLSWPQNVLIWLPSVSRGLPGRCRRLGSGGSGE